MGEKSPAHKSKKPKERSLWDALIDRTRKAAVAAEPRVRELADNAKRTTSAARAAAETRRPEAQRLARKAADGVKQAADATMPEVNRLAQQARPRVERAAKQAVQYGRKHDKEIKRAAETLGRAALPASLRVAADALQSESGQEPEHDPKSRDPQPDSPK
jgi:hypothetical protein